MTPRANPDNHFGPSYLQDAAPCSVVLPAGCGKTETLSGLAAAATINEQSVLILTHTNAGVQAIRQRLLSFGINSRRCQVQTIDSWCFELVRRRPTYAGLLVPSQPIWTDAHLYHQAGLRALTNQTLLEVFVNSFDLLLVDEYQDCTKQQHQVFAWLSQHVPTIVFGDPLQGIFDFGSSPSVHWQTDVEPVFPEVYMPTVPWRWNNTNPSLGEWLLSIRPDLIAGRSISFDAAPIHWTQRRNNGSASIACRNLTSSNGSVIVLGKFRHDCIPIALSLSGSYQVMEELEGKTMQSIASTIDSGDPGEVAAGIVEYAIGCAVGVARVFSPANRDSLRNGQALSSTRRPHISSQVRALNKVLSTPSPLSVLEAMMEFSKLEEFRLYCREAWEVLVQALTIASSDQTLTVKDAVSSIRNNARSGSRLTDNRQISRPVLVKGLQFDHVVLANGDNYNAKELYVALTRGTTSVTVVCASKTVTPLAPRLRS